MASSTEHIDELLEWRPGAADAARTDVLGAFAWGARRASASWGVILLLWAAFVVVEIGGGSALLAVLRNPIAPEAWRNGIAETFVASPFGPVFGRALYRIIVFESPVRELWLPTAWFVLLYGVFAGGAIAWLHAPRPAPLLAQYGAACGRYVGRFARLLVSAALLWWVVATLSVLLPLAEVGARAGTAMVTALVAAVMLLAAVIDYARVRTVTRDSRSTVLELLRSARFFLRHLPQVLGLELLLLAVTATLAGAAIAAHQVLAGMLSAQSAGILVTQLLTVALLWLRLAAWGAMLSLYQGLTLRRLERSQ